jgi:hypothetical protein
MATGAEQSLGTQNTASRYVRHATLTSGVLFQRKWNFKSSVACGLVPSGSGEHPDIATAYETEWKRLWDESELYAPDLLHRRVHPRRATPLSYTHAFGYDGVNRLTNSSEKRRVEPTAFALVAGVPLQG